MSFRELCEMSKYYFDGQGKAIRPVIALTLSHAMNTHVGCKNTQVNIIATCIVAVTA